MPKLIIIYFVIAVFIISFLSAQHSSVATHHKQYDLLLESAKEAQNGHERKLLDSIADQIVELGESENNDLYYYNGLAYKSEALTRSRPEEAIDFANRAIGYFENKSDLDRVSRIFNSIGHSYGNLGNTAAAIEHYRKALDVSNESADRNSPKEVRFRSGLLYNMGFAFIRVGELDKGAQHLYECLEENGSINDSTILSSVHVQLGNIKMVRGQLDEALSEFRNALSYRNPMCQSCYRIAINSIAGVYQELGQLDSALYYSNIVLPEIRESGDIFSLCVALFNLSELYIKLDKIELAISHSQELIRLAKRKGFKNLEVNGYNALANAYFQDHQLTLAQEMIDVVVIELDSLKDYHIGVSAFLLASKIYENQFKYKEALQFQRKHQSYADSILNQQSQAQIDELTVQYESKEKEAKIIALEQQHQLDEAFFKQRLTLGIGVILAIGLLASMYILRINKKRFSLEKQRENIEQRLLRSQMNPHFIFNAISSIQTFLFEKTEIETALNYLSKFATLMRQILENSREEFISLSDEIESLKNYLDLQQLRYSNSFQYTINTESIERPHQLLVPPLIAQPFVENAIEHGKIYLQEEGIVTIEFSCTDDMLVLRIIDNGKEQDTLHISTTAQQIKKKSLATIITRERLNLMSVSKHNTYDLESERLTTGGTAVTIELPKIHAA